MSSSLQLKCLSYPITPVWSLGTFYSHCFYLIDNALRLRHHLFGLNQWHGVHFSSYLEISGNQLSIPSAYVRV